MRKSLSSSLYPEIPYAFQMPNWRDPVIKINYGIDYGSFAPFELCDWG